MTLWTGPVYHIGIMPNDLHKDLLNNRWQEVNDALAELANLHVWPTSWDIDELEGELLQELDKIEYQLGQDLYDRA